MNRETSPSRPRADLLLSHEWQVVLDALRRDMRSEEQKAEQKGPQWTTHGYNASVIRRVLAMLGSDNADSLRAAPQFAPYPALTGRERDIAALLARRMTAKEIGRALGISHRTVDVYRSRLLQKFNVRSSAELSARWLKRLPRPDAIAAAARSQPEPSSTLSDTP